MLGTSQKESSEFGFKEFSQTICNAIIETVYTFLSIVNLKTCVLFKE